MFALSFGWILREGVPYSYWLIRNASLRVDVNKRVRAAYKAPWSHKVKFFRSKGWMIRRSSSSETSGWILQHRKSGSGWVMGCLTLAQNSHGPCPITVSFHYLLLPLLWLLWYTESWISISYRTWVCTFLSALTNWAAHKHPTSNTFKLSHCSHIQTLFVTHKFNLRFLLLPSVISEFAPAKWSTVSFSVSAPFLELLQHRAVNNLPPFLPILVLNNCAVSHDGSYDLPNRGLNTVACSDGENGLIDRYGWHIQSEIAGFPYIAGSRNITGWNSLNVRPAKAPFFWYLADTFKVRWMLCGHVEKPHGLCFGNRCQHRIGDQHVPKSDGGFDKGAGSRSWNCWRTCRTCGRSALRTLRYRSSGKFSWFNLWMRTAFASQFLIFLFVWARLESFWSKLLRFPSWFNLNFRLRYGCSLTVVKAA